MATIRCNGKWVQFNSHENQCFQQTEQEQEEEEEETLSLCDLPTNDQETETTTSKQHDNNDPEDFEFGSCHKNTTFSTENMCNADEVFFQGQILPLRHSISSATSDTTSLTRKINRSTSMIDPRTIRLNGYNKYKPRVRNQFHSHPSPSPQIRTQSFRALSHSNPKNASLWSFLQVGLVKPQEIGLSDLKNRSKRFGSHNSNSSSNSSGTDQINQMQNQNKVEKSRKNMKKKQRLFFVGGCKCSVDSVERTIKETVPKKKTTKDESLLHLKNVKVSKESKMIGDNGKQAVSRHRTFEWLKQLSIAAPTEA
ncbi:hypothetical protein Tco_0446204 [Tanacetum coccineum]